MNKKIKNITCEVHSFQHLTLKGVDAIISYIIYDGTIGLPRGNILIPCQWWRGGGLAVRRGGA